MTGSFTDQLMSTIVDCLRELIDDKRTLFVVSSDFCHWGTWYGYQYLPEGEGQIYEKIEAMDREAMEKIGSGKVEEFAAFLERTRSTICGNIGIQIMMKMFKSYHADFPAYAQSSRVTKFDDDGSVSYVAGVIRPDPEESEL